MENTSLARQTEVYITEKCFHFGKFPKIKVSFWLLACIAEHEDTSINEKMDFQ